MASSCICMTRFFHFFNLASFGAFSKLLSYHFSKYISRQTFASCNLTSLIYNPNCVLYCVRRHIVSLFLIVMMGYYHFYGVFFSLCRLQKAVLLSIIYSFRHIKLMFSLPCKIILEDATRIVDIKSNIPFI